MPAIAVMIGEAENSAISVRSGDSRIPISRRSAADRRSTVSTVKNANSGMLSAVTTERYPAGECHGVRGQAESRTRSEYS